MQRRGRRRAVYDVGIRCETVSSILLSDFFCCFRLRPFAGLTGVLGTSAEGNAVAGKQNVSDYR